MLCQGFSFTPFKQATIDILKDQKPIWYYTIHVKEKTQMPKTRNKRDKSERVIV